MSTNNYEDQIKVIADGIERTNPAPLSNAPPDVTYLAATLTTGRAIRWVTADLSGTSHPEGKVMIFTDGKIISIKRSDQGDLDVAVTPRRDLHSFEFSANATHHWGKRDKPFWPTDARITATFADGSTVSLPLGDGILGTDACAEFAAFLPDLLRDVT
ncbi:hypothetical protein ACFO1B_33400 [Dactylosporangium siamense]|uniref:Uncharacterized protein n=1 Tax=Dactylosporangium siamense TaxID=685454 RepID=A0A919PH66_9ACTN|nr:hypothetical protein [Dactylosporangium siamense]GIG42500.1 hypothetical protein Dsi01nite_005410 [Dactylosporangium siamense]